MALVKQGVPAESLRQIDVAMGTGKLLGPAHMELLEATMPPQPIDDFNDIMALCGRPAAPKR